MTPEARRRATEFAGQAATTPVRVVARNWSIFGVPWRPVCAATILILIDWMTVFNCLWAAWWFRHGVLTGPTFQLGPLLPFPVVLANLYYLIPWTLAFAEARLYSRRTLFWSETRQVLRACTVAALFAGFLSFAVRSADELSRLVIAGVWVTTIVAVPIVRINTKRFLVSIGLWGKRVLIVGAGETGVQVAERIRSNPVLGYEPVAFVDDDPRKVGQVLAGLPVRGPLTHIPALVGELAVKDIVVALPRLARDELLHVISRCEGHVESIRVVPDMFGLATVGVETEDLDGMLLLHMRWNLAKPWNLLLKRAFDLAVGTLSAVVLLPALVVAAVAIRLDSPGPILYRQQRLGRGWQRFRCYKFRTMYRDGGPRLETYLASHPDAQAEWERYAKLKSYDPRVTRVGGVLRRLSFDEVPQLVNVFKGEMSLVGPRPYLPREVERMGDFAETILKAPPGISGLWQVSGRNELTFSQRLRLDEYYVRNWSLWLDLIVLVKTIGVVLRRQGAY